MEQGAGCSACTCNHSAARQKQVISELEARPGGRHSEFQDSQLHSETSSRKQQQKGNRDLESRENGARGCGTGMCMLKSAWSHVTWSPEGRGDGRMGTAPITTTSLLVLCDGKRHSISVPISFPSCPSKGKKGAEMGKRMQNPARLPTSPQCEHVCSHHATRLALAGGCKG